MKIILTSIFLILNLESFSQNNPFVSIDYDKVIAYEFEGLEGMLIQECLKSQNNRISNSIVLSETQVSMLENLFIAKSTYGNRTASCFDPHFALVYMKNEQIVASIDVCLSCNYLLSSIKIDAQTHKMFKISDDYSYHAKGFSKDARNTIHEFCKTIGFTKYLESLDSMFDQ